MFVTHSAVTPTFGEFSGCGRHEVLEGGKSVEEIVSSDGKRDTEGETVSGERDKTGESGEGSYR